LQLPGLALAHRLYERTRELGYGRAGTQALYLALAQESTMSEGQGAGDLTS